jgi:hypothetical protein
VLQQSHEHPEITIRKDALLSSINARLGRLIQGEDPGVDLTPLSGAWISELYLFQEAELVALEEARDESEAQAVRANALAGL